MATVEQKIRCEHRARELMRDAGAPPPDYVEYGFTCIRFLWRGPRLMCRIDIDEEWRNEPVVLVDELRPSQPPLSDAEDPGDADYDPLRTVEEVNCN